MAQGAQRLGVASQKRLAGGVLLLDPYPAGEHAGDQPLVIAHERVLCGLTQLATDARLDAIRLGGHLAHKGIQIRVDDHESLGVLGAQPLGDHLVGHAVPLHMVAPVKEQDGVRVRALGVPGDLAIQLASDALGIGGQHVARRASHGVGKGAVTGMAKAKGGEHGAIGAFPEQRALVPGIDAPPDEGAHQPESSIDLRQLAVVAKHIAGKAGAGGLAAQRAGHLPSQPQVAHQRFTRDQELVRHGIPGPDDEPALAGALHDLLAALGAHLQVILQQDGLAVRLEGTFQLAGVPALQDAVHELDQAVTELLKGLVPLTVPVGAEHIMATAWSRHERYLLLWRMRHGSDRR